MKKIAIDLFSEVKYLSNLKHQGNYLSYIMSTANVDKNHYESSIYLYDLFKKSERKLTAGKHDRAHMWLNDEEIIFQSKRETPKEKVQKSIFYKINIHGGEAEEFLTLPYKVGKTVLMNNKLYFLAPFNEALDKIKDLKEHEQEDYIKTLNEEDDYDVITEIPFWSNGGTYTKGSRTVLYSYDFESKEVVKLTEPPFTVMDIYAEVDFNQLYITGQTFVDKKSLFNELYILDNGLKRIDPGHTFSHRNMIQINDEEIIYNGSDLSKYGLFENGKFYKLNIKTKEVTLLTPDLKLATSNAVGSDFRFGNVSSSYGKLDNQVVFMLLNGFKNELHTLKDGSMEKLLEVPGALDEFVVVGDKLYGIGLFNQELHEIYDIQSMEQLTSYNKEVKESYDFLKPEHFIFENRAGLSLDGFIIKVSDNAPTILNIHGGPKTAYGDILYHEMQYWASEGYNVIFTNPRGSEGRDNDFADIRGKYGTIDYEDIMDFVDACIEKYNIDADKMGVTGGSYGGFMTNWIIGHNNRFKAAATQRSISNWFSFYGTSDIGYFFGPDQVASTPWDNPELMWQQSPIKYADKIKTPTLLIHSHEDYRCWTPDAYQMFTALKHFNVPSRMVMFKGENHELSRGGKPKHRIRRLDEITKWMDYYLKEQ